MCVAKEEKIVYEINLDFDAEGDSPSVQIIDSDQGVILEVFEEPTLLRGQWSAAIDAEWSWESEDWEPGPFAKRILDWLNSQG